jgi:dihydroorotase
LNIGADGDVTVLDPDREWVAQKQRMASKAGNSPFLGWRHKGKALATIVGGNIVWRDESAEPGEGVPVKS